MVEMYNIDISPFGLHVVKLRALLPSDVLNLCDVPFTLHYVLERNAGVKVRIAFR